MTHIKLDNPVITGIAVTNTPHLKLKNYPSSVVNLEGVEYVKVPFILLGKYKHPTGVLNFDQDSVNKMLSNHSNGSSDNGVAIKVSHLPGQPAIAWAESPDGFIKQEGNVVVAYGKPTSLEHLNLIKNKVYKFASVELYPNYTSNCLECLENKVNSIDLEAISEEEFIALSDYRNADGTYRASVDGSKDELNKVGEITEEVITEKYTVVDAQKMAEVPLTDVIDAVSNVNKNGQYQTGNTKLVTAYNSFKNTLKHFIKSDLDELRIHTFNFNFQPDIMIDNKLLFGLRKDYYYISKDSAKLLYDKIKDNYIDIKLERPYIIPTLKVIIEVKKHIKLNNVSGQLNYYLTKVVNKQLLTLEDVTNIKKLADNKLLSNKVIYDFINN